MQRKPQVTTKSTVCNLAVSTRTQPGNITGNSRIPTHTQVAHGGDVGFSSACGPGKEYPGNAKQKDTASVLQLHRTSRSITAPLTRYLHGEGCRWCHGRVTSQQQQSKLKRGCGDCRTAYDPSHPFLWVRFCFCRKGSLTSIRTTRAQYAYFKNEIYTILTVVLTQLSCMVFTQWYRYH